MLNLLEMQLLEKAIKRVNLSDQDISRINFTITNGVHRARVYTPKTSYLFEYRYKKVWVILV